LYSRVRGCAGESLARSYPIAIDNIVHILNTVKANAAPVADGAA
jgi:hypothetical protein